MSYAPDETPHQLLSERTWLQGAIICAVAYGAEMTLFSMCFYLLFQQARKSRSNRKMSIALLVYITVIVILGSCFMASNTLFTQLAFIDNRNYPGGPAAYEEDMFSETADEVSNVAFVLANWLADALIVWRFMVIYKGCRFPLWTVMLFPCVLFSGSFVMGTLWLIQISASSPWGSGSINWTIPYFTLSLALNILLTIAIVIRLLIFRHRIASALGPSHGSRYTSIAAMIVESASVYSMFSILFLVPFVINNPISQVFLQSLGQVQNSATLLIVFRVALGRAWSSGTQTMIMSTNKTTTSVIRMGYMGRKTFSSGVPSSTALGNSSKASGSITTDRNMFTDGEADVEVFDKEMDSTSNLDNDQRHAVGDV